MWCYKLYANKKFYKPDFTVYNCGHIQLSTVNLYNNTVVASNKQMPFNLLQKEENLISFNPNECNLANDMFFNHTRQQSKDVKIWII